jgi:hypothetical protein
LELAQGLAGKSLKLSKFRKAALNADPSKPVPRSRDFVATGDWCY